MAETKPKTDEFSLEEDDIFEDFEVEDYKPEQSSEVLWDADWDDEDAPQEFKDKLTAELKKHSKAST